MKINIISQVFSNDGYASHVRQFAIALNDLGHEVSIECQKPVGWELMVDDKLFTILQRPPSDEIVIAIALPMFWPEVIAQKCKHFIGYIVWEGSVVPEFFLEHFKDNRISQIWTPSQHVLNAISNTCKKTNTDLKELPPIFIIPEGVDTNLFKPMENPDKKIFSFVCNKGWVGGMYDRGGVQFLLKNFKEEFRKSEDIALLLKINPSYNGPNWNFFEEVKKIGIKSEDGAPILINSNNIPFERIPQMIYSNGDCFVCPTRAEAFGLTFAEAMACGLPVITTNYGGQTEFIKDGETGLLVDYKLESANGDTHNILYEEVQWAVPDGDDLKRKMRWAFENQDKIKEMGVKAREYVVNNLQWKHAALKAQEALEKL